MKPFYRSNHDQVAELTWENGQLGFQELAAANTMKPTWGSANETLESIVQQTSSVLNHQQPYSYLNPIKSPAANMNACSSFEASSTDNHPVTWMEPGQCSAGVEERSIETSACGTNLRDSLMTRTTDEDLPYGSDDKTEAHESKGGAWRSSSTRRSRTAAVHNQSERRRRDRINQKMKTLQKLVPNASKTDKASMLDEVIKYLKQLQTQVQMINFMRTMPQMMVPLRMQQQQLQNQMSLLARTSMNMNMGLMGMGGMMNMMPMPRPMASQSVPHQFQTSMSASPNPLFLPHFLMVPPLTPNPQFSQSMNMDLYHNPTTQENSSMPQSNYVCMNEKSTSIMQRNQR